ncbi:MAG TPA: DNA-3-methyladenine glycosylase 2 family protein [Chloroflexi bacterium]|nr:DNA-3-methyladenine glycosylase 2 family protein [Chloroflexota bacterium]HHW85081.1 DNA-3-methyladenine glycosylase 2 family protein [Chloroflexota bacterium]
MLVAPLTEATLHSAVAELARRDADLARIVARIGPPPLWARSPGFPTLVLLILEQQVSLASARAAYNRLETAIGAVTPAGVLSLAADELRSVGFSRQKAGYVRALATAIQSGVFDPDQLSELDDDGVRRTLTALKGIGAWTAEIYLLMVLRRPDAWPTGDLALATAAQQVKGLAQRPTPTDLAVLAEGWRPWRAVAARLLWHHYLTR